MAAIIVPQKADRNRQEDRQAEENVAITEQEAPRAVIEEVTGRRRVRLFPASRSGTLETGRISYSLELESPRNWGSTAAASESSLKGPEEAQSSR